ncbi:MAG TPA: nitronate monooxygenase [Thermomicrobiales bacterium]|nr:nitronate monooxygenase [Thermomicrobiales bacterium]
MLHTRLCDLLGIEHPIISAPMAGSATADLAAAVSAAGGFGLLGGTTPGGADWLRAQIRAVRERTDRPFGVGFITAFPDVDDLVRVALEERVAAISHSFADPTPYVAAAHAAGVKVLNQVQTVAQARTAVRAGVDAIAAQGTEAGGHTGYSGTLPLVPAVVDVAGAIPVVAAGGIADGRGLAAVLMLGAEGAWLGTRFVASREWAGGEWAKARVVAATADDTVLTHAYDLASGAPFPAGIGDRVLHNDYTAAWHGRDEAVVAHREELAAQLRAAQQAGDARVAAVRAGNAASLIGAIEPAGEIVRRIAAEAERVLRERPARVVERRA